MFQLWFSTKVGNVKFTNEWKGHIIDQFFSFSQKKNLHKVFNKQKKYNRSPHCAAAEPKFVHISSSEEVGSCSATHICRDVDVLKKSKKLDWQANKI